MNTRTETAAAMPVQPAAIPSLPASPGFVAPASRLADLPGPPGLPVIGNTHQLVSGQAHRSFEKWADEYGPMFKLKFGKIRALVLTDPVLIHELLRRRPLELSRNKRLNTIINELGDSRGLFSSEGDTWKRQRKLVMRALTPEAIKHFFPILLEVTRRLEAKWHKAALAGQPVNAARDLKRYSIDVTTWLSMGVDIDTLNNDDNPLQDDVEFWFQMMGRRLTMPFSYWHWVKLPVDRKLDAMLERMRTLVATLIADARARLLADPARRIKPPTILEALVAARDEPDSEFTDSDVEGNIATMLFAGEDTTANAMAWMQYHLATHPQEADIARREADAVTDVNGLPASFADLDRFDYLEAVAHESMRLKPIAPMIALSANMPMDLAGVRVEANDLLVMLTRRVGTSEEHFPDAMEFKPQRWLEGGAETGQDQRRKVFPFGGGPRFCPGRYLAMVEMKMVSAMALRRFNLAIDVNHLQVNEHFTFTLGPDVLSMQLTPR